MKLWIYQLPNPDQKSGHSRLHVQLIDRNTGNVLKKIFRTTLDTVSEAAWVSKNISTPNHWITKTSDGIEQLDLVVKFVCINCKLSFSSGNQPFLTLSKSSLVKSRKRRSSMQCHETRNSECCLDTFVVNFKEIGWSDWILAPESYDAKTCKGECKDLSKQFLKQHTIMVNQYGKQTATPVRHCCSPTKFKPLSLLYRNNDNVVIKATLNQLVADECQCT